MSLSFRNIVYHLFYGMIGRTLARMCPDPITHVRTADPVAALTFDDGPHSVYTPKLLDVLKKNNAKATFFMVGETASKNRDLVKMVAREGHAIGNHAQTHVNFTQVKSPIWRLKQLKACEKALAPYSKKLFRPPFGAHNDPVKFDALLMRYKIVLWNQSAQDWIPQSSEEISWKITDRLAPGTIFLLHDALQGGGQVDAVFDREVMIEGLARALDTLKGGLHFVTLPELLRAGRPICQWPR